METCADETVFHQMLDGHTYHSFSPLNFPFPSFGFIFAFVVFSLVFSLVFFFAFVVFFAGAFFFFTGEVVAFDEDRRDERRVAGMAAIAVAATAGSKITERMEQNG